MCINPRSKFLKCGTVQVDGRQMHVRVSSVNPRHNVPPVVLVHGLGVSGRYMIPLGEQLSRDFQVFIPDLPGFGKSDRPPTVLDTVELADVLDKWMEVTGLEHAVFIGNSYGCQIIVELAIRHPHRVTRAVFLAPTVDPEARTAVRQIGRILIDAFREPFTLLPIAIYDYLAAGLPRVFRTFHHLLSYPTEEYLPNVRVPVLCIVGSRDPIVPLRWANRAASLAPDGRLIVLTQVAHGSNYSAPEKLVPIIRPFLLERSFKSEPAIYEEAVSSR